MYIVDAWILSAVCPIRNPNTVSPQIAYIFVQKIHRAIWNRVIWIYTRMWVKIRAIARNCAIARNRAIAGNHAILRNRAILLVTSNTLGPKN